MVECKLGGNEDIDETARKLLEISSDIDQQKTGQHAFSMILTKGNLAYRRPDGVYVIPLATLKP